MLKFNDFSEVQFIKSIAEKKNMPSLRLPEIAFAGRSNVGKSSLLNSIFNRKKLVKTSSTPGKTQLINYFSLSDKVYCVDLPGYGYAKLPMKIKQKWQKMLEDYFLNNSQLKNIYLLIDSRHDLMNSDKEMIDWLSFENLRFSIILSKCDKLNKSQSSKALKYFKDIYPNIPIMQFSVKQGDTVKKLKIDVLDVVNS